jgi:hypothetical protein
MTSSAAAESTDPPDRIWRGAALAGAALILVGCAIAIVVPAGLGWDFANYYDAGRKALAGQYDDLFDPRASVAEKPPQGEMLFLSAPISAFLYTSLAVLPPEQALIAFKIENTIALFASLWLIYARTRALDAPGPRGPWFFAALFVLMAGLYQPFWSVYRVGGQMTPTALLLLTGGSLLHADGKFHWSAACYMLAGLIKPFLAPGLIFISLVSGPSFWAWAAAYGAIVTAASVAVMGLDIQLEFIRQVAAASQEKWPPEFNSALTSGLESIVRPSGADGAGALANTAWVSLAIAAKTSAVALTIWLYRGARAAIPTLYARRFFVATIGAFLALTFSTVVWEHYLSYMFILLAIAAAARREFPNGALALVAAILVLSVGQNVIVVLFLRDLFRFDTMLEQALIAQFKGLPLLLTVVLVLRYRSALYRAFALPGWRARLWRSRARVLPA